jgi:hypothetical protein
MAVSRSFVDFEYKDSKRLEEYEQAVVSMPDFVVYDHDERDASRNGRAPTRFVTLAVGSSITGGGQVAPLLHLRLEYARQCRRGHCGLGLVRVTDSIRRLCAEKGAQALSVQMLRVNAALGPCDCLSFHCPSGQLILQASHP